MRLLLTIFFLFSFYITVHAQEAPLTIKVTTDKNEVALDEYFNYKVIITSSVSLVNPKIKLPDLEKDFAVLSSSRSQNIAFSGATTRLQIVLNYFLKPKKEGEITLGPAEVSYRGKNYTSEALTIKVYPAKGAIPKEQPEEKEEENFGEKITL